MVKKAKIPWPTKAVMEQIYDRHLWGGEDFDFYSGWGSHDPNIVQPYLDAVIAFLKSFKTPLTICDLGCGDFNVGKHLVEYSKTYVAVDIVENLIERNKKIFKADNLEFQCLDIAKEKLPTADCIILRQVLQHLSNAEIKKIVEKLANYRYVILTEHIPTGNFEPNKDIISGQGNRVRYDSGVTILEVPFNFRAIDKKIINEYILENNKERIVSIIYQVF